MSIAQITEYVQFLFIVFEDVPERSEEVVLIYSVKVLTVL
jgi:hypothetical protein